MLGSTLYNLFAALPQQYRRHALTVYRHVIEAGCNDLTVRQAALLHDLGKFDPETGRYVTIIHRVAVVLLEALPFSRTLLRRLSRSNDVRGPGSSLLYPFHLSRYHPALGARLAAQNGASAEVVALIAGHHKSTRQSKHLLILQAADDNS